MRLWCRAHPRYLAIRRQRTTRCWQCKFLFALKSRWEGLKVGKSFEPKAPEREIDSCSGD